MFWKIYYLQNINTIHMKKHQQHYKYTQQPKYIQSSKINTNNQPYTTTQHSSIHHQSNIFIYQVQKQIRVEQQYIRNIIALHHNNPHQYKINLKTKPKTSIIKNRGIIKNRSIIENRSIINNNKGTPQYLHLENIPQMQVLGSKAIWQHFESYHNLRIGYSPARKTHPIN